jgi:hypothetical protein
LSEHRPNILDWTFLNFAAATIFMALVIFWVF